MRITANNYKLSYVLATSPIKRSDNGTTQPILIRGINESNHKEEEYYLKLIASERMSTGSLFELIASFMAHQIGLNAAEPAIINVTSDFAELCRGKDYFKTVKDSIGINFGSKNIGEGIIELLIDQPLSNNLINEALKVFTFDSLIQNTDRGHKKSNLLTDGRNLYVYDHELAFSYCRLIGASKKEAWKLDENGVEKDLLCKHLFYNQLKKSDLLDFEENIKVFDSLDEKFWEKVESLIPIEWMSSYFGKIKNHSLSIVKNLDKFNNELKRILS